MFYLDHDMGMRAIYGGWFLGGGGGGLPSGGIDVLENALSLGRIEVLEIDEFDPAGIVVTASLVGSPSTGKDAITPAHCVRAYHLFNESYEGGIAGFISNEAGGHSITNGWIAAAVSGKPIVDAACNGRAHPTGVMGAMGLDSLPGYQTLQVAVGGAGDNQVEISTRGSISSTSKLVREASTLSRGFISVLRNPVDAAYVKQHGAIGALGMMIEAGDIFLKYKNDPDQLLNGLHDLLGCQILFKGVTGSFDLTAKGGFDVGSVMVRNGSREVEITFWNEYMTAESEGGRLATFPDLVTLLDARTGLPICSAQVQNGLDVIVVNVPKEKLLLSTTMFDRHLYLPCEAAIGKEMIRYVFQSTAENETNGKP